MAALNLSRTITQRSFLNCSLVVILLAIVTNSSRASAAWDANCYSTFCVCFLQYGQKWANCTGHRLYTVHTGLSNAVQALDISNNSISSLANYDLRDAGLTRLKLLNFSSNAITEIGLSAFAELSELKVLDLSKNHLYFLLPDTFIRNNKLQVLILAGNNLNQHVPKLRSFSLVSLDLSNCGISYLAPDTFNHLPKLRTLYLTDNMMIELKLDILREFSNLNVLLIERNPWSCNREMYELLKRLKKRKISFKKICNDNELPETEVAQKKSEKMVMIRAPTTTTTTTILRPIVDSEGSLFEKIKNWQNTLNVDTTKCQLKNVVKRHSDKSDVSAYWYLLLGFIMGLGIGTTFTYLCMATNRISMVREPEASVETCNYQRVNLLRNTQQNSDDTSNHNPCSSDCPGTPPPPYRDVMLHANRYPQTNLTNNRSDDQPQIHS